MQPYRRKLTLPEIRFRTSQMLLDLVSELGAAAMTRGKSLTWHERDPSHAAYYNAISRLRKSGLIVSRKPRGETPRLILTSDGNTRISQALRPKRLWQRKWKGYWFLISYDIPETQRSYRRTFRNFLSRMRMGCLQRSVWISPDNIRDTFHHLMDAAAIEDFGVLLKCKEIIGRSTEQIVHDAWPFDKLNTRQSWYCNHCEKEIQKLRQKSFSKEDLIKKASIELKIYLRVMVDDPLLPKTLWPRDYRGEDTFMFHKMLMREIKKHL